MIADAIMQAQKRHRALIEATYDGTCNIYEKQPYKDPDTMVTSQKEVLVKKDIPCRLSFSSASATLESGSAAGVVQTVKLFLAPEVVLRPGSKIEVVQNGRTECYSQSGKPAVYSSHQEVVLELWKGYA